eukprot:363893-Chlamydomonas_euryale.AAC.5
MQTTPGSSFSRMGQAWQPAAAQLPFPLQHDVCDVLSVHPPAGIMGAGVFAVLQPTGAGVVRNHGRHVTNVSAAVQQRLLACHACLAALLHGCITGSRCTGAARLHGCIAVYEAFPAGHGCMAA